MKESSELRKGEGDVQAEMGLRREMNGEARGRKKE